ncbi:Hsp70 family protein [Pedosphaera parvula]|uniref:Molecular chaperone-like protein n=1 Tax=Pedosphaera parvula (strain Ellin514) TaxID=320771 RepID=B9XHW2_PEDPL|nr:Hsp70 family protein [Pedosphaera parvula]EEF60455.1 molecular chaperone-like protein [Pedosphaera parvula Ellin514]
MANYVCGIDFGTSNSAVAVYDLDRRAPSPLNAEICRPIPSLLYFPTEEKNSVFVGDDAVAAYVRSNFQGRFLQALKTFLTFSSFTETRINGRRYELPDLVALMMRQLKQTAEKAVEAPIDRVVLGRPVKFAGDSPNEELATERLYKAAKLVGFKQIEFEFEPVAAARYYQTLVTKNELVLVGDFGGGTSDFTLMSLSPSGESGTSESTVLGTAGVPFAGNKFDSELMRGKLLHHFGQGSQWWADDKWLNLPNHIFLDICEWHQIPFLRERRTMEFLRDVQRRTTNPKGIANLRALIFENYGYSVFQRIEEAKIRLSSADQTAIDCALKEVSFHEPVSLLEFNGLIQPHISAIRHCVQELLQAHSISDARVDNIFLTGGTSEVTAVKQLFIEMFGANKVRTGKTFTSVAEGLGLTAGSLFS